MCGFVGFLELNKSNEAQDILTSASARIARRGPDAESFWSEGNLHLAHRRLAIVDLTPGGLQPMTSACGRYVLVFNGEIYNHHDLRLEGELHVNWRGTSDTEVLLEHFAKHGVAKTLTAARGMFAFALWDKEKSVVTLGRDRLGEKPLFFGWMNGRFIFGSELKVLKAFPGKPSLNEAAVAYYLRHGYVPAPLTIYSEFFKVRPGTFMEFDTTNIKTQKPPVPHVYWSVDSARLDAQKDMLPSADAGAEKLENILAQSVKEQLMADVPVGALLSGGIDSSLIAALAQANSTTPIKTFTIGFADPQYDEAPFARKIAQHLGTDHHELYITESDVLQLVAELANVYDEPFADSSQLPTLLVSRLVRKHVTVCLSGDGGDELFRGYERYLRGRKVWKKVAHTPTAFRSFISGTLRSIPVGALDFVSKPLKQFGLTGSRIHKACDILSAPTREHFYHGLAQIPGGAKLVQTNNCYTALSVAPVKEEAFTDFASRWDCRYYLPDDILTKVDRAAMHESLETRVPLLRPEVLHLSWRLTEDQHIQGSSGKQVLRKVLAKYVPTELFERPKKGFGVPLDAWMRGPLKSWAEERLRHLSNANLAVVNHEALQQMWREHQSGKQNWSSALWAACMLGLFLEQE